jgi:hypothetical protein
MATASDKDDVVDVDWSEEDWDRKPSQLAQEAANHIWDMPLYAIYERAMGRDGSDPKIAMWCEWIQQAIYHEWLLERTNDG